MPQKKSEPIARKRRVAAEKKTFTHKTVEREEKIGKLISSIESSRNSKVIVYFTGDKKPEEHFATQVAPDILAPARDILRSDIKNCDKVTLVINTNGGLLDAPWPFVNLIREYCKDFEVFVMEKSLSAGTLIALGADKIIMSPYSSLSPIDPARTMPDQNQQIRRIEIEDIVGYIDFVKDKVGITDNVALSETMKALTTEMQPTQLGSANRAHALIRGLAKKMLSLHKSRLQDVTVKQITDHLTKELYSHKHLINRKEAKEEVGLGNVIEFACDSDEDLVYQLFEEYQRIMEIKEVFDPGKIIGDEITGTKELTRAVLHSKNIRFNFVSRYEIMRMPDPTGQQKFNMNNVYNEWERKQI